jgi:hypothetical protein
VMCRHLSSQVNLPGKSYQTLPAWPLQAPRSRRPLANVLSISVDTELPINTLTPYWTPIVRVTGRSRARSRRPRVPPPRRTGRGEARSQTASRRPTGDSVRGQIDHIALLVPG